MRGPKQSAERVWVRRSRSIHDRVRGGDGGAADTDKASASLVVRGLRQPGWHGVGPGAVMAPGPRG